MSIRCPLLVLFLLAADAVFSLLFAAALVVAVVVSIVLMSYVVVVMVALVVWCVRCVVQCKMACNHVLEYATSSSSLFHSVGDCTQSRPCVSRYPVVDYQQSLLLVF